MFANMALDESNSHLIFKYDQDSPLLISPVETTIFSGPMATET